MTGARDIFGKSGDRAAELGRLVRIRRKELGLTIEQAVRASGLSRSSWQGIEHARSRSPRDASLRSIDGAMRWKLGTSRKLLDGDLAEPEIEPERDIVTQLLADGSTRYHVEAKSRRRSEAEALAELELLLERLDAEAIASLIPIARRLADQEGSERRVAEKVAEMERSLDEMFSRLTRATTSIPDSAESLVRERE